MIQSRPVDVDGRFVGVAVQSSAQWHFVAVDPVLEDLRGACFPSARAAEETARQVLARARRTLPPAPRAA
jgi:hypothetical protein